MSKKIKKYYDGFKNRIKKIIPVFCSNCDSTYCDEELEEGFCFNCDSRIY